MTSVEKLKLTLSVKFTFYVVYCVYCLRWRVCDHTFTNRTITLKLAIYRF